MTPELKFLKECSGGELVRVKTGDGSQWAIVGKPDRRYQPIVLLSTTIPGRRRFREILCFELRDQVLNSATVSGLVPTRCRVALHQGRFLHICRQRAISPNKPRAFN
jgi:hypothetical protein